MERMRKKWNEWRNTEKDCGVRGEEGTKLTCSRSEKEMFGKEDIGNVIFIERMLIPDEENEKWVKSEKRVDVIENVILEKEKEKEGLMEKDCVNGNSLLCNILWNLIHYSFVSVESAASLSKEAPSTDLPPLL
jgi:hypothetical protein